MDIDYVSKPQGSVTFPANFMLVGAMNPCPCGYFGDTARACSCSRTMVSRYQKRISGPLLDRIDIFVEVPRVDYEKLTDDTSGESSESVRQRVEAARGIQKQRLDGTGLVCNADMTPLEVREFCRVEPAAQGLLQAATNQMHLSARAFHRILKLSRTVADLDGSGTIAANHLAESLQYRPREQL